MLPALVPMGSPAGQVYSSALPGLCGAEPSCTDFTCELYLDQHPCMMPKSEQLFPPSGSAPSNRFSAMGAKAAGWFGYATAPEGAGCPAGVGWPAGVG